MTKKNVAISGYYGFENFGDEAILKVLSAELLNRGYVVTVFSKSPSVTSENLGVNSIYTFDLKGVIKTLKNCDVLFSGGGSLLQDATSLKSLFYYLFVIAVALFFKKDVVIFAQGIGPIKNSFGRFVTKRLLKKCKYITVRDDKSFNLLKSWNLEPVLVSDPVWGMTLKEVKSQGRVGIQLRSWKGLSEQYLQNLAKVVALNFADKDIYIYSFQDTLDFDLCSKFEQMLKDIIPELRTKVLYNLTIDEIFESFSELDYLIGMRYHACLLAIKYGIPTVALSYDTKVDKLSEIFDLPCSKLSEIEDLEFIVKQIFELDGNQLREKANEQKFDFSHFVDAIES